MKTKEYYVTPKGNGQEFCDKLNDSPLFPITGKVNGQPAPDDHQKTETWATEPKIMLSEEEAIPGIPDSVLDEIGVDADARKKFLSSFSFPVEIRKLTAEDFPEVKVEEPV